MKTVMIISGESSGELYGALLSETLRKQWPGIHIIGVGGERMKRAGVEIIAGFSSAFGLIEAVSSIGEIRATFNKSVEALKKYKPEILILIDYPDFNLKLARVAKELGLKILYYVSPQVWAWRKGRVKKIAALIDRMAVILPFEEEIYRQAGIPCDFVGHPIIEEIETILALCGRDSGFSDKGQNDYFPQVMPAMEKQGEKVFNPFQRGQFRDMLGLDAASPLLALLPGSRPSELKRHLPVLIEVVKKCKNDKAMKTYQFCMPLAPNTDEKQYSYYLDQLTQEGVEIRKGESLRVLAASDLAVVTSGTATLQTALLEVPMVVIYKLSKMSHFLGRMIIKVKFISLVNLLAGRGVVIELIQNMANASAIIRELRNISCNSEYRDEMIKSFRLLKKPFLDRRPSRMVSGIIAEMAGWKS
jgi:lipid-A-disaccharide synthase